MTEYKEPGDENGYLLLGIVSFKTCVDDTDHVGMVSMNL